MTNNHIKTFFSVNTSPTNYLLNLSKKQFEEKKYIKAHITSIGAVSANFASSLKNLVNLITKVFVAAFALTIGQIPAVKEKTWSKLEDYNLVSNNVKNTCLEIAFHLYKTVLFLAVTPLLTCLGTSSPHFCSSVHQFARLIPKESLGTVPSPSSSEPRSSASTLSEFPSPPPLPSSPCPSSPPASAAPKSPPPLPSSPCPSSPPPAYASTSSDFPSSPPPPPPLPSQNLNTPKRTTNNTIKTNTATATTSTAEPTAKTNVTNKLNRQSGDYAAELKEKLAKLKNNG